jgi:hypothetical protein
MDRINLPSSLFAGALESYKYCKLLDRKYVLQPSTAPSIEDSIKGEEKYVRVRQQESMYVSTSM